MLNNKFLLSVFLSAALFILSSCSKKDPEMISKDNNTQFTAVDDKDVRETDKDLKEVDYKDIYDKLSSKGQWIQVSGKDLNLKSTSSIDNSFQRKLFSFITGINEANAETQSDPGQYFVWKPADNLAVQLGTPASVPPTVPPAYVPYVNGKWVNTDAGWYFQAPTPEEEIVHHYGRWVNTPTAGYVWAPGRVWAPAWVDWRDNQDNYVAWAPLPLTANIVNDAVPPSPIDYSNYVVVDKKYFVEPNVYKYYYPYPDAPAIVSWNRPQGIVVVNNTVINKGPDVQVIEKFYGTPIQVVKINHVTNFNDVKYSDKEFYVYSPIFQKIKDYKVRTNMPQPKNFARYEDFKGRENENKDKGKDNDDNSKDPRDNKTMHKDEKENKKLGDDRDMHKDKEQKNGNRDNGNKDKDKDKGNGDNGHKDKGDGDNGHKDKGNRDNGHDNGHKDKGTEDNGHKDKGDGDKGNKENGDKGHGKDK